MHPYAIGLDIGVASVGWAITALNSDEQPCGIIDMGARIFDAAEHPKTGASLAAPRREARSARRRLRRHRHRAERIRHLLVNSGLLTREELEGLFDGKLSDIYELRVKALDEKLSREEFARVLIHISQRRGFKSNRRSSSGKEDGKILDAVKENNKKMLETGYRTVGEMLLKDPRFSEHKRNVGGEYISTVTRAMIEDEVHAIFAAQRKLGQDFAAEELEQAYVTILLSQRSFDEGPGGNSPYGGNIIENMIGQCTLYPEEKRTAKAAYSFEYFSFLQKLNNIRLITDGSSEALNAEQRSKIIEAVHTKDNLTYAALRKLLNIGDETLFNMVRYENCKSAEECEKKEKFTHLKAYHQIRKTAEKVCKGSFSELSQIQLDGIGNILTKYKNEERVKKELLALNLAPELAEALLTLNFSGYGHISLKACEVLIPQLEKGLKYNEACDAAGRNFRAHDGKEKTVYLHPDTHDFDDITSPVVRRAVSQTVKVVNAIIRKMDSTSPVYINIELAREMSKDFMERGKIRRDNENNSAENERLKQQLRDEYGINNPTGQDILKFRLWKEQDGICAYSLKPIPVERLFEANFAEIDHIVPYSISFDDTRKNKVLVLTAENRNKGNRLPLQYLSGEAREKFIVYTKNRVNDKRKRENLLRETMPEEGFKERNLQDTKYIAVFMQNYLRDNLAFAPSDKRKNRVTAVNGAVTAYMRKRWGITKIREDGDLHHAVDALVISCVTPGMIQKVSRYSRWHECQYMSGDDGAIAIDPYTGEVIDRFPYPWPVFRKELEARLCNDPQRAVADLKLKFYMDEDAPKVRSLFVSRMPRRKVTGAAHKDTVRGLDPQYEGYTVTKTALTSLKLKDGEIENYYEPGSDRLLYEALLARLTAFGGDAKKAFADPFRKPKSDGTPGPIVKKVKLLEKSTLNVPVHNGKGAADNDSMVRIDVFKVEGDGYYFVPIYVADTLKPELPNKACVQAKPYPEWKEMSDENFVFSLYPNDLISVKNKRGIKLSLKNKNSTLPDKLTAETALLYYSGSNIACANISVINHDNTYTVESMGIKTLTLLEKYTVDILGEYHPVGKERRMKFNIKRG